MGTTRTAPAESKKDRYWGEERNARRRQRYQDDPVYRAEVLQRARQTQFEARRVAGFEVSEGEDCRRNLPMLDASTQTRDIEQNGVPCGSAKTVTTDELARALNRDPQVLYRWMGKGMLPRHVCMPHAARSAVTARLPETLGRCECVKRVSG